MIPRERWVVKERERNGGKKREIVMKREMEKRREIEG